MDNTAPFVERVKVARAATEHAQATWCTDYSKDCMTATGIRLRKFVVTLQLYTPMLEDFTGAEDPLLLIQAACELMGKLPASLDELRPCWKPRKNGARTAEQLAAEWTAFSEAYTPLLDLREKLRALYESYPGRR